MCKKKFGGYREISCINTLRMCIRHIACRHTRCFVKLRVFSIHANDELVDVGKFQMRAQLCVGNSLYYRNSRFNQTYFTFRGIKMKMYFGVRYFIN